MITPQEYTHLTFDCYGTLIDWESGILASLGGLLRAHGLNPAAPELIQRYATHEARLETPPYRSYRNVLRGVVTAVAADYGVVCSPDDLDTLARSVSDWPPFPDTIGALQRLQTRYRLAVLSNIDDDLFADTAGRLGITFDAVITAQQVGRYKPDTAHFDAAVHRLGCGKDRILHVAQSLYHDHVPAQRLGWTTVWVNRPSQCPGVGVTPPADVRPDAEVTTLEALADLLGC